jgi:hypothetical protein
MVKFILGISGKQGSGKTTLSTGFEAYVAKRWGMAVKRLAFAGPIYDLHDMVQSYLSQYGITVTKKNGQLLQALGDLGRSIYGDDLWISLLNHAAKNIHNSAEIPTVLIVEDIRLPSERDAVRAIAADLGAQSFLVRLSADQEVRKARCEGWRENTAHLTETALEDDASAFDLLVDTANKQADQVLDQVASLTANILSLEDPDRRRIECALDELNEALEWIRSRSRGANFRWVYGSDGSKELSLISVEPVVPLDKERAEEMSRRTKEILEAVQPEQITTQ